MFLNLRFSDPATTATAEVAVRQLTAAGGGGDEDDEVQSISSPRKESAASIGPRSVIGQHPSHPNLSTAFHRLLRELIMYIRWLSTLFLVSTVVRFHIQSCVFTWQSLGWMKNCLLSHMGEEMLC